MKIFALADENKSLVFYLDNEQTIIPKNAFEINAATWEDAMQHPTKYVVENGVLKIVSSWVQPIVKEPLPVIDKKALVISSLEKSTTIAQLKSALITYINNS